MQGVPAKDMQVSPMSAIACHVQALQAVFLVAVFLLAEQNNLQLCLNLWLRLQLYKCMHVSLNTEKICNCCRLLASMLQGKAGSGAGSPSGTPPNGRSGSIGSSADDGGSVRKGSPLSSMRPRASAATDAYSGKETYQPMLRQGHPSATSVTLLSLTVLGVQECSYLNMRSAWNSIIAILGVSAQSRDQSPTSVCVSDLHGGVDNLKRVLSFGHDVLGMQVIPFQGKRATFMYWDLPKH